MAPVISVHYGSPDDPMVTAGGLCEQSVLPEGELAVSGYDDMVMNNDVTGRAQIDNGIRHGDIFRGWLRISTGMVVDHDEGPAVELDGSAQKFARIDRYMAHRSFGDRFIPDQTIAGIKEENPELLAMSPCKTEAAIIHQLFP